MKTYLIILLLLFCGCDELRRNGKPGDAGYIAPRHVEVTVIEFEPGFVKEVAGRTATLQAYSVVESADEKRYRIPGRVGPVGDSFKLDVSLLKEIGQ